MNINLYGKCVKRRVKLEAITISSSKEVSVILNIVMSSHQVELKSMLSRLK